jgi:hypothetical protein
MTRQLPTVILADTPDGEECIGLMVNNRAFLMTRSEANVLYQSLRHALEGVPQLLHDENAVEIVRRQTMERVRK